MEAVDNLGWLHEQGMGVRKDPVKARKLYLRASEKGHVVAQLNLARCLRDGIGGAIDLEAAIEWSATAFRIKRDSKSGGRLVEILIRSGQLESHTSLLADLATVKSHRVLTRLARIYHEGIGGIPKDRDKAAAHFARARKYGLPSHILDGIQLDELATRTAERGRFGFLPTTHMDQGYNMCAPTSAAMALSYYSGKPVDPYRIKRHSTGSGPVGTGTCWDHMLHGIKHVSGAQWTFRSFPKTRAGFMAGLPILLAEIDARRPVLIDLGPHTVVLVGYDATAMVVYIQNPAYSFPGVHTVNYDELRRRWHSPWHVSTTGGKSARPMLLTGGGAKRMRF